MARTRVLTAAGAGLAVALALAGCGSSTAPRPPGRQPAASTNPNAPEAMTIGANGQEKLARAALTRFLDTSTPVSTKLALLQSGASVGGYLRAHPNLGRTVSVVVHDVRVDGPTALYTFDLTVDGRLTQGLRGNGVYMAGAWQVTLPTYCGLLTKLGRQAPSGCATVAVHLTPSASPTDYPPVPTGSAAAG